MGVKLGWTFLLRRGHTRQRQANTRAVTARVKGTVATNARVVATVVITDADRAAEAATAVVIDAVEAETTDVMTEKVDDLIARALDLAAEDEADIKRQFPKRTKTEGVQCNFNAISCYPKRRTIRICEAFQRSITYIPYKKFLKKYALYFVVLVNLTPEFP
jgi:hypothetical protein